MYPLQKNNYTIKLKAINDIRAIQMKQIIQK